MDPVIVFVRALKVGSLPCTAKTTHHTLSPTPRTQIQHFLTPFVEGCQSLDRERAQEEMEGDLIDGREAKWKRPNRILLRGARE